MQHSGEERRRGRGLIDSLTLHTHREGFAYKRRERTEKEKEDREGEGEILRNFFRIPKLYHPAPPSRASSDSSLCFSMKALWNRWGIAHFLFLPSFFISFSFPSYLHLFWNEIYYIFISCHSLSLILGGYTLLDRRMKGCYKEREKERKKMWIETRRECH